MTVNAYVFAKYSANRFDILLDFSALRIGQGVLWFSIVTDTTRITNTDAIVIVTANVCATFFNRSPLESISTNVHEVMITDVAPPSVEVPLPNVAHVDVVVCFGRAAMNNNTVNLSHVAKIEKFPMKLFVPVLPVVFLIAINTSWPAVNSSPVALMS